MPTATQQGRMSTDRQQDETDPGTTVCLTFDFDAVSAWLHMGRDTPTNRTRGRFGAEVAAPRLLDVLADDDVETTWFVPGHTADSYPELVGDVHDAGHELAHHGWSHVPPNNYDAREVERDDLVRGIESLEAITGEAPAGYRSPSWDYSPHTVDLLADLGFEWSSSGMAREYDLEPVRRDRAPHDAAYERGDVVETRTGDPLVEVPVSWQRDDFPPFAFLGDRGFVDEAAVFENWRRSFDYCVRTGGDAFVLTFHPQVIGKGHRIERLRDLIETMQSRDGVEFATVSDVVDEWRALQ